VPDLAGESRAQLGKILVLAVAAGDHDQRSAHAGDRGERCADIGALGVVDIVHTGDIGHPLRPVRQAAKSGQRFQRRGHRHLQRLAHRERRHRVGSVVEALYTQVGKREQRLATPQDHRCRLSLERVIGVARDQAESEHALAGPRHRPYGCVVDVDHRHIAAVENPGLGCRVVGERRVAIHVIGRHVQHGCSGGAERMGRLELEARQLEHEEIRYRLLQQIKGRLAEIAAGERASTRGIGQGRDQGGDRALAIRARHRGNRRACLECEQFDVAHYRQAAPQRLDHDGLLQRKPG
jgi:hypothetical protein